MYRMMLALSKNSLVHDKEHQTATPDKLPDETKLGRVVSRMDYSHRPRPNEQGHAQVLTAQIHAAKLCLSAYP